MPVTLAATPVPGYGIYPAYCHLPPSGYPCYPAGGLFWIDDRLDIRRRLLIQDIRHNTYPYIHIICYLIRRPVLDTDIRPAASYSGYRYIRRNTYPYYYPLSPAGGLFWMDIPPPSYPIPVPIPSMPASLSSALPSSPMPRKWLASFPTQPTETRRHEAYRTPSYL